MQLDLLGQIRAAAAALLVAIAGRAIDHGPDPVGDALQREIRLEVDRVRDADGTLGVRAQQDDFDVRSVAVLPLGGCPRIGCLNSLLVLDSQSL